MGLSTWQLAEITLTTPYSSLLLILALRGLGLGCLVQSLTVSALSKVQPRQYAQASSLNTVIRFVSTSLGIAVLAFLAVFFIRVPSLAAQKRAQGKYVQSEGSGEPATQNVNLS